MVSCGIPPDIGDRGTHSADFTDGCSLRHILQLRVLMSKVLDHCESQGRRLLLLLFYSYFCQSRGFVKVCMLKCGPFEGSGWMYYFVVTMQATVNTRVSIGSILLARGRLPRGLSTKFASSL
jgi:hypothetical protein